MGNENIRKPKEKIEIWRDGVTGLMRRDSLENAICQNFQECVIEIAGNNRTDYSVIMFDVDYFKAINDIFSHKQGDSVLKELGEILNNYSRNKEFVGIFGRWGGEEFVMALPYSATNTAKDIADEIRKTVECHKFEDITNKGITLGQQITISLGISSIDLTQILHNTETALNQIMHEADIALDYAKYMGRNNVQIFGHFLKEEINNLEKARQFYFEHSSKKPGELKKILKSKYLSRYPDIKRKLLKHFEFIRTELNPRDTRTKALLADGLYHKVCAYQETTAKQGFLDFLEKRY